MPTTRQDRSQDHISVAPREKAARPRPGTPEGHASVEKLLRQLKAETGRIRAAVRDIRRKQH